MAVVHGAPLVSYVMREALSIGCRKLIMAASADDHDLEAFAKSVGFDEVTLIPTTFSGTLEPVLALVEAIEEHPTLLSTCDVFGPPGAVQEFVSRSASQRREKTLVTFCGSSIPNDDNPIWIHSNGDGTVTRYGKQIEPSGVAFANIRVCYQGFGQLVGEVDGASVRTDTELMSAVIANTPGCGMMIRGDTLFDVDTPIDLERAQRLVRYI